MYWGTVDLNLFRADTLRRVDWGFYAFAMSVPFMLLSAVIVIAVDWLIDLPACLLAWTAHVSAVVKRDRVSSAEGRKGSS
jgi:hypothetical protein